MTPRVGDRVGFARASRVPLWIHSVSVRIVKEAFLGAAGVRHPRAEQPLAVWVRIVRAAKWARPADLRRAFPDVDPVRVGSGHTVWVFNIRRNEFRLIAAIHFERQRLYTLRFFTHAEYSRN